ncbi:hypothetical protein IV203_004468 [Nitzschia inconspicua]|uniref:Uncharacterized protein n=1 Tax=Nitzschia inconspicua TaxID=303405 RepID=A0A9K3L447_9STRA|nr:hypothetical protein IV203_004468 [Nitzschia inconspicua]
MSNRKLQSSMITEFFPQKNECTNDVIGTSNAAAAAAAAPQVETSIHPKKKKKKSMTKSKKQEVTTQPRRDLRSFVAGVVPEDDIAFTSTQPQDHQESLLTADDTTIAASSPPLSSSLSLVTAPFSTGPSARLVTTQKKRKDPPPVSTAGFASFPLSTTKLSKEEEAREEATEATILHTLDTTATTNNQSDTCVTVGNTTMQSMKGNAEKCTAPASSSSSSSSSKANATNPGNRATGAIKAVTKWRVQNNDQSVAELLRTHGPKNGQLKGEVFWIKTNQNVVTRPTDGTPSTKPSILFPDGKLVYDDFCLLGLRERFRERHRQNTCHNTVQAIKHPDFKLKACTVHTGGYNHVAITCEGYTQVYIEAPQSKQVVPSATCITPLDQHTSQPIHYSKHGNDCVVCVAKAYQQYPGISRREMRQKRLVPKSCFGCPQCKKGKGVSVCKTCWKHFDHELHYMK